MRTVWKFTTDLGPLKVELPVDATVLHVEMLPAQTGVDFWVELDTDEPVVERTFVIFGTGHPIKDGWSYRGTGVGVVLVWHLYEQGDN